MTGNNVPCINIRALGVTSTARAERKLDDALGLGSMFSVSCGRCGGDLAFDTDDLGRSVDRCRACGHVQPLAPPAARPVGDGYKARQSVPTRREPRRLPDTTDDPHVQLLREARAERAADPMPSALAEAKRAFDAMQADAKEARKGGRPRGMTLNLGRPKGVRHGPVVILDDDGSMPLRPPAVQLQPLSTPMATTDAPRTATECGHEVASRGPIPKLCADCRASGETKKPRAATKRAPRETTRRRVSTGYKPPRASSNGGGYAGIEAFLEAELTALDARREKITATLASLRELSEAE